MVFVIINNFLFLACLYNNKRLCCPKMLISIKGIQSFGKIIKEQEEFILFDKFVYKWSTLLSVSSIFAIVIAVVK